MEKIQREERQEDKPMEKNDPWEISDGGRISNILF